MRLNFEKFLNENGLKAGDKIKLSNGEIYEIYRIENTFCLLNENDSRYSIAKLQEDFEIVKSKKVKPKKKVGDLLCKNVECDECPLYCIRCDADSIGATLRENLEENLGIYPQLEPMRTYLEAELDKEVE